MYKFDPWKGERSPIDVASSDGVVTVTFGGSGEFIARMDERTAKALSGWLSAAADVAKAANRSRQSHDLGVSLKLSGADA